MKRVVAYKRKSTNERKVQIYNCVSKFSANKGFATITDIANELGMTSSTHLKKLVLSLVTDDLIDLRMKANVAGIEVYQFYMSANRLAYAEASCWTPWSCTVDKPHIQIERCKQNLEGLRVVCPVHDIKRAARDREAEKYDFDDLPDDIKARHSEIR